MIDRLIDILEKDTENRIRFSHLFVETVIPSKTVLLHDGEVARCIYIVKSGCLRQWFNKEGKDITLQFFFEGQPVSSIDSFLNNQPSLFTLESIEPSTVIAVSKQDFQKLTTLYPEFKEGFRDYLFQRFRNYAQLFLSRIKDSPKERYDDLVKNHPDIIRRVPQHYIASYLGITPISLSRIRNRK